MKPKTIIQKRVYLLSQRLPTINERQKQWAYSHSHCLEKIGLVRNKLTICLECNHRWEDKQPILLTALDGVQCPNCNTVLKISNSSRKRVFQEAEYCCIITKCKEFQVLRYFWVEVKHKLGTVADYSCTEVVQRWIDPQGKTVIMALARQPFQQFYYDKWVLTSKMEIKPYDHIAFKVYPIATYPYKRWIPELKRNGFKGSFHGTKAYIFIPLLLSNSKCETLLKAKQYGLLSQCINKPESINENWSQIKIAIRNNYYIPKKHVSDWIDYLGFLKHLGKDVLSPKYVCVSDIKSEHDKYLKKRKAQIKADNYAKLLERIEEEDIDYQLKISKFNEFVIVNGNICISPLKSVHEFYEEGEELSHCVFSSSYHKRNDILVLSAKVGNLRTETIEISLKTFKVIQCRGRRNKFSEYHKEILHLMESNIPTIQKLAS